jgi:hypothetical protein
VWHEVITTYTGRTLTKQSDKLIAFEGIAQAFRVAMGAKYYAAILENWMHQDLLWSTDQPSSRPQPAIVPTWSWVSVTAQAHYLGYGVEDFIPFSRVLSVRLDGPPSKREGYVELHCDCRKGVALTVYSGGKDITVGNLIRFIDWIGNCKIARADGAALKNAYWRPDETPDSNAEVFFAAVSLHCDSYDDGIVYSLVLQPTSPNSSTFKRIGLSAWMLDEWFGSRSWGRDRILRYWKAIDSTNTLGSRLIRTLQHPGYLLKELPKRNPHAVCAAGVRRGLPRTLRCYDKSIDVERRIIKIY